MNYEIILIKIYIFILCTIYHHLKRIDYLEIQLSLFALFGYMFVVDSMHLMRYF